MDMKDGARFRDGAVDRLMDDRFGGRDKSAWMFGQRFTIGHDQQILGFEMSFVQSAGGDGNSKREIFDLRG